MRLLALVAAVLASAVLAPAASAYRIEGRAWPGGLIPYFNAAGDQAWAVEQAVNAWNTSGARVRFVPVAQRSAKLVIRSTGRTSCDYAEATVGYRERATVWIWKQSASWSRCDPYWATGALVHELGHVLGLGHEDRGCAAMNPSGSRHGPTSCEKELWAWRCRLLEHDDVTGAVALYGGSVRARPPDPTCELYRPIGAPQDVSATIDAGSAILRVRLRRPVSPTLPSFLRDRRIAESYVALWGFEACPVSFDPAAPRYRWSTAAGQVTEIARRVPAGARCLSVWAVDSVGRPSARPASVSLG